VRRIFEAPTTTARERKQLLRAIIAEVVVSVDVEARTAAVRILWEGGASTELVHALNRTGGHFKATDEDTVDLVRRLAAHYDDRTIAVILSRQKRRTGTGLPFSQRRVATLRVSRGIPACPRVPVPPNEDNAQVMSITQAERELGVNRTTLYRWLSDGFIVGTQLTPQGPWHLRVDDELRAKIVPDVPDGWLTLDAAAKALGVARQTVLHKVQRGELHAVHVNRGKRRGLRIQVERPEAGLFETP
jgi:excisionase family DNA binding protein